MGTVVIGMSVGVAAGGEGAVALTGVAVDVVVDLNEYETMIS